MVERFICPANRLLELAGVLTTTMTEDEEPWSLVATARPADAGAIADFVAEMSGGADVEVVETVFPDGGSAAAVAGLIEEFGRVVYFEVPWRSSFTAALDVLVAARAESGRALGVKVRCGGVVAEAFPPPDLLASLLLACRDRRLPIKATAGLHHPFRHADAATGFIHHGFINLLAATALAHGGADLALLTEVLADTDPGDFSLEVRSLTWRQRQVDAVSLAAVRSELFVGYGSCSFDEPVTDLAALGMLPVAS
jgi:hypothetical protein